MNSLSDRYRPKNQAGCDHANALREYEAAHKVWMDTSVYTGAGREAKRALGDARDKLNQAAKAAHPGWTV